jgi:hypothetical protein
MSPKNNTELQVNKIKAMILITWESRETGRQRDREILSHTYSGVQRLRYESLSTTPTKRYAL